MQEHVVWAEGSLGSKGVQAAGSPPTSVSLKHHHPTPSGSAELLCRTQKDAFFYGWDILGNSDAGNIYPTH